MGVKISELNSAEQVQNNDVLPIVQNDETKKVTKEILLQEVVASLAEKAEANNVYTKEESNTLLNGKVDKVAGKGLSTEDYTTEDKGQVATNTINIGALQADSGATIELEMNTTNYVLTAKLKNKAGTVVSTTGVDLPIESAIVNGYYDNINKKIVLVLQNGNTIDVPVGDLISGLQAEITEQNKLSSDLVDDTNKTNKFVTSQEKTNWNAKYDKPVGGIPKSDLSSDVQASLGKADTALQEHQDISGKEDKSNKVTEITDESTDTQYPSAKAVYDSQELQDEKIEVLEDKVEVLEDKVEVLEDKVEILENTVESELSDATATGPSITVNDSANAPAKLGIGGNTYQDGEPSPTNEVPINNVSRHNEFIVQSKNFFDETNLYHGYYVNNVFFESNSYRTMIIDSLPAGTYTFSTTLSNCKILRWWGNAENHDVNQNINNITITTTIKGKVMVCFRKEPTSEITETFNTQLEKGETATSYLPYKAPQTAEFTLATGQKMYAGDYLADDGIHQLWGEITLDGVNNKISKNDSNANSYLYIFSIRHEKIAGYCSHFSHYTGYPSTQSSAGKFNTSQSAGVIYFNGYGIASADNSQLADASEFNAWLQTHNVTIQYKLETPVTIAYTETQQAQYNAMKEVMSYFGQTNVDTISAGDLEAFLNLDYKKSNNLRIKALEQAIISLGGNV